MQFDEQLTNENKNMANFHDYEEIKVQNVERPEDVLSHVPKSKLAHHSDDTAFNDRSQVLFRRLHKIKISWSI